MPSPSRSALLLVGCALATACANAPDAVLVLAAVSTIDAMESAARDFNGIGADTAEVSFASSSVLARQIEEGAPADLMLSASVEWADYVERRVPVRERVVLLRNRLVVIAPAGALTRRLEELADDPEVGRIAIADPSSVPAGIYAAQALQRVGLWESVTPRVIPALDARATLALVADGEADAGVVYATDAAATRAVSIVAEIDPALHDPIEYPLLLMEGADPAGHRFFEFLQSPRGRAHFVARGFLDATSERGR